MKNVRVSKAERKKNAVSFYNIMKNGISNVSVVVIDRHESTTNPYVHRTQLLAVIGSGKGNPDVIAESAAEGVTGCMYEFLENIGVKNIPQSTYPDANFNAYLQKTCGFIITYNDGFAMIWSR